MSPEEKITSKPETVEPPKLKRRFKLDKKHLQGFIAGILLCAIAFTGLYYGTDGLFFSGTVSGSFPVVTDANFESVLEQPDRYIIVASNVWKRDLYLFDKHINNDKIIIVELDPVKSKNVIEEYNFPHGTYYAAFFNGQKVYSNENMMIMRNWINRLTTN